MKLFSTLALAAALSVTGCATHLPATELLAVANAVAPEPGIVSAGRLDKK